MKRCGQSSILDSQLRLGFLDSGPWCFSKGPARLLFVIFLFIVVTFGNALASAQDSRKTAERVAHSYVAGEQVPVPEDGAVTDGFYVNKYFGFTFPLPHNWSEGFDEPPPSNTGYYVLSSLRPRGVVNATILISAVDLFFYPRTVNNSMGLLQEIKQNLNRAMKAESGPAEVKIANHPFARFDFRGAGLYHAHFATDIRCHVVSFVITTGDKQLLKKLVQDLNNIKFTEITAPVCVKNYASGENVLHKVYPAMTGPKFTTVPVRVIIGTSGRVKQMHVIHAFPEQAKSIEDALMQWVFKPYTLNGNAVEVETGILFEFRPKEENPRGDK